MPVPFTPDLRQRLTRLQAQLDDERDSMRRLMIERLIVITRKEVIAKDAPRSWSFSGR